LLAEADDLFWFAEQVNVKGVADLKGRLTGDIDLDGAPWSPIGIDMNVVYSGTFDGDGHQVFGLNINSEDFYQGLFGYVKYATIKNLTVSGQVNGTNYCTGGIAGIAMYSTIDNCVNTAAVQGTVNSGGIAGNASGSSVIQNCSNKGSVGGTQYVGGICGQATSTTYLQKCINYGQVVGDDRVGGITGANAGTKSGISLTLCVNKGAVSAHRNNVGGITGYAQKPVASCYNTGTVLGKKSDADTGIGGIAGYVQKTKITNCYNIGSISCSADPAQTRVGSVAGFWASDESSEGNYYLKSGALHGIGYFASGETAPDATVSKTADQMKALATTLGDAYAADTYQINGGYPVLAWQCAIAKANQEAATAVIQLIEAIGQVDAGDACRERIEAARRAFDLLNEDRQILVTNEADLKAAEAAYAAAVKDIAAVKKAAKNELDNYKKPADYREAQKAELAAAITKGKAAIGKAADVDAVNSALAAAKAQLDKIKTNAQLIAEEEKVVVEKIKSSTEKIVSIELGKSSGLSKTVLQAIKDSGKKVTFVKKENGKVLYSWTFDGGKVGTTMDDIDLKISFTTDNKAAIDKLAGDANSVYLSFTYEGKLPAPALIKVYVGEKYKDGDQLNLYYFNKKTKRAEDFATGLTVKDGYVSFTLTHLSDYFLTQKKIGQKIEIGNEREKEETKSPATGDRSSMAIWSLICGAGILAAAYLLMRKRRSL
jgi:hypothetical protein